MTTISLTTAPTSNAVRSGVLLMLLGMVMFSLNDVLGKWLVASYSVSQLMLIRSLAALVVLSPYLWKTGVKRLYQVDRPGLHFVRCMLFAFEALAFYFIVFYMPLADAMTYWLAAPIYVAALSPLLLGEKVGWRRWCAIVLGFVGVVIALEPSSQSFTLPALVAIAGSFAFALAMVLGRTLRAAPDSTLVFWQIAGAAVVSVVGVVVEPNGWRPMSGIDFGLLCLLGVVAMSAHMLVNRSLKLVDAATVVPLQYTLLLWAIVFGWLFFGDVPRPAMLVGSAVIVASGLFIFFREQQLKRRGRQ
ncbi:DMT family transporter [Sinorhizobium sp. BG8]|uniref:DMT family transporter n=1 Tax=Sinorhizobium sp. BG8 TaxID=2613773 RepID=UPI00193E8214|nr:DMT family transporter [Sinorhizobium sp. BG8]QRM57274.1 DMT family transporter [Sinorhizobium sp. BG8]